ncbi:hypothetical protein [Roseibium alexandrii]|uniref:hypothetical protein n=1 Tax=Roseibium alexandrii TaxID=388408 RepID=UPI0006E23F2F|nr:hypothetical protein [Roseibium alexandrii]
MNRAGSCRFFCDLNEGQLQAATQSLVRAIVEVRFAVAPGICRYHVGIDPRRTVHKNAEAGGVPRVGDAIPTLTGSEFDWLRFTHGRILDLAGMQRPKQRLANMQAIAS